MAEKQPPPPGFILHHTLSGHKQAICQLTWSPDGSHLASSSYDNTVRIWEAESGLLIHTLDRHNDTVFCVAWAPNGRLLASGSRDNTVCIWEAKTGMLYNTLIGHTDAVRSVT